MVEPHPPSAIGATSAGDPYLPSSGNGGYAVEHYDLDLDYRVSSNRLNATATITARADIRLERFSLDFASLTVDKVTVDGIRPRKTSHTARKLAITPLDPIEAGERFEIVIRYRGTPRPVRSLWGDLGWEELRDGVIVAGQPCGAASWFPCNDHPSDKATFRIAVTCEPTYTVVSNGALVARSARSGGVTWQYEVTEPMATYLATVLIGRYVSSTIGDGPVPLTVHHPANLTRQVGVDFDRLGDMLDLFIDQFGPYPFESYTVVVTDDALEIPLEAQGLAVFGRNHVDGMHGSDRFIAHELAHQWFGNSLTIARWRDIWLHEGFACYAEWLWEEASGGRSVDRSAMAHWKALKLLPADILIGDPGPKEMFDDRVYKRGALAVHAVRRAVGDAVFFDSLRAFTHAHRHGTVEAADFVASFGENHGQVVRQVVDRWVYTKALPAL